MGARLPLLVGVLALATAVLAGIWLLALRGGSSDHRTAARHQRSYAELVAANYRILSPEQSSRLLRFADAFSSCMSKHGIALGHPQPRATKIVMAIPPGVPSLRLSPTSVLVKCGDSLGGPPKDASLVQPKHGRTIELYLPKQCLLDRKVLHSAGRSSS